MNRTFQTQDSDRQRFAAQAGRRKDASAAGVTFAAAPAQLQIHDLIDNSARVKNLARVAQMIGDGTFREKHANSAAAVAQRATEITHTADYVTVDLDKSSKNFEVGKEMEARLDVGDPVVGTATGANWTWMQALRNEYPKANVVRGHLLNHDLGGFSNPENLYPISTEANANHSSEVEQKVKAMLNLEYAKNHRVHYDVKVKETNKAHNPKEAVFECSYGWEKEKLKTTNIASKLGSDTGGFRGSGSEKAHADWAHGKGRGKKNIKDKGVDDYDNVLHLDTYGDTELTEPTEAKSKSVGGETARLLKEHFGFDPVSTIKDELDVQGIGDDELDVSDIVYAMMQKLETFKKYKSDTEKEDAIKELVKNLHKAG